MPNNPTWERTELILALELYIRHGRTWLAKTHPDVVLLSEFLRRLPLHDTAGQGVTFRNPAGVALKIENLRSLDPESRGRVGAGMWKGGQNDQALWDEYGTRLDDLQRDADAIRQLASFERREFSAVQDDDEAFPEGRLLERLHKHRERNRAVVASKLKQVQASAGRLACEACGFDFAQTYGEMGEGFAECHHRRPLGEVGETSTRLADLAVVCANCHRMLHRSKTVRTVEALKALMARGPSAAS